MSIPRPSASAATHLAHAMVATVLVAAAAACTPPPDSPTEKPTEPRAAQLRDAVHEPLDAAHGAQRTVDADAQRTRAAIDAAGG